MSTFCLGGFNLAFNMLQVTTMKRLLPPGVRWNHRQPTSARGRSPNEARDQSQKAAEYAALQTLREFPQRLDTGGAFGVRGLPALSLSFASLAVEVFCAGLIRRFRRGVRKMLILSAA